GAAEKHGGGGTSASRGSAGFLHARAGCRRTQRTTALAGLGGVPRGTSFLRDVAELSQRAQAEKRGPQGRGGRASAAALDPVGGSLRRTAGGIPPAILWILRSDTASPCGGSASRPPGGIQPAPGLGGRRRLCRGVGPASRPGSRTGCDALWPAPRGCGLQGRGFARGGTAVPRPAEDAVRGPVAGTGADAQSRRRHTAATAGGRSCRGAGWE